MAKEDVSVVEQCLQGAVQCVIAPITEQQERNCFRLMSRVSGFDPQGVANENRSLLPAAAIENVVCVMITGLSLLGLLQTIPQNISNLM